ncbi:MAG: polysaccharide biosynthesis C-terminal domain-containing protein [Oscillospiraceae bacterium]|nr:polysaccharide biosynthesis C-terminal domain-containing protein [Oscillospiraceae bacterium]
MQMSSRITKLKRNSLCALIYYVLLVISGFLLTGSYLRHYGSEAYGLSVSVAQFLSLIALCDMGVDAVISAALYRALAEGDLRAVSRIMAFSRRFFGIIGLLLLVYVAALTLFYPSVTEGTFDRTYTVTLILAMSISQFEQFYLGMPNQILLNADQRSYVPLAVSGVTLVVYTAVSAVLMALGGSIQTVKLAGSLIYLARPAFLSVYVRKHYALDRNEKASGDDVPQKLSSVVQHISYTVSSNTDVAVLTLCSSIDSVSVYSVYTMITGGVRSLIISATTGIQALFGNLIANGEYKELNRVYSLYEWAVHTATVFFYTVTGILIVPFVTVYTKGINDAEYRNPGFAALITAAFAVMMLRDSGNFLIRAAGHFRQTRNASITEALLNLGISVLLVRRLGLIGVAAGTLSAALFFLFYQAWYFSKDILKRPAAIFLKQICLDAAQCGCMLLATSGIRVSEKGYMDWFFSAITVGTICVAVSVAFQLLFFRHQTAMIKDAVNRHRKA